MAGEQEAVNKAERILPFMMGCSSSTMMDPLFVKGYFNSGRDYFGEYLQCFRVQDGAPLVLWRQHHLGYVP